MNELAKLKKWFLLGEAAEQLSLTLNEKVSAADVLRLALDEQLVLSVRIVTPAKARPGLRLMTEGEAALIAKTTEEPSSEDAEPGREIRGGECIFLTRPQLSKAPSDSTAADENEEDGVGLIVENYVVPLQGEYDLLLFSDGYNLVEGLYHELIQGPVLGFSFDQGVYVVEPTGRKVYQLQQDFAEGVYAGRHRTRIDRIRHHIEDNNLGAEQAQELFEQEQASWDRLLRYRSKTPAMQKYMPAEELPLGSTLIVRAESLAAFGAMLLDRAAAPKTGQIDPTHVEFDAGITKNWKARIQAEATRMILAGREVGAEPVKHSIAPDLARWCKENKVVTDRGISPSAGYIRNHVLSSKFWKAPGR